MFSGVVFWQLNPSIHQAPLLRELAGLREGFAIHLVLLRELEPARAKLGWGMPDFGPRVRADHLYSEMVAQLRLGLFDSYVHVFSSARPHVEFAEAFSIAIRRHCRIALYCEARRSGGVLGLLRRIDSLLFRARYGRSISAVLSIGENGEEWFRKSGLPASKVIPFAYFVDAPRAGNREGGRNSSLRLVFVGALVERKSVAVLIAALASLPDSDWSLDIIGDGPLAGRLKKLCASQGLIDRIRFLGPIGNDRAKQEISRADVLLLPSAFDGWGAVGGEALLGGTALICSDACGVSACALRAPYSAVFREGDVSDLRACLAACMNAGPLTEAQRSEIREWCVSMLPVEGATYLDRVLSNIAEPAVRPLPPWSTNLRRLEYLHK